MPWGSFAKITGTVRRAKNSRDSVGGLEVATLFICFFLFSFLS
jgi:hypothetical protein